ncbi:MerR family transcriptional regulator [Cereibacter sphaeroides]|jgi:DNA-binding transcriptional MerR regulator|uniref:MerR family transcriptional regulator n=1 Tax=Cereibacter sphaeroides TaxID=1063 RepID=UPI0000663B83|nr:putative transcriptional regulator, MerR family [Cereibacter sphaeroides ATCC 17029]
MRMEKSAEAFRTISEVADILQTPAHVLRFWESRFPQIRPVKRAGGRRYYRPSDVALLAGIRRLLHDEGMTIRGVQKILREQGVRHVAGLGGQDPGPDDPALDEAPFAAVEEEPRGEVVPFAREPQRAETLRRPASASSDPEPVPAEGADETPADPPQTPVTETEPAAPFAWSPPEPLVARRDPGEVPARLRRSAAPLPPKPEAKRPSPEATLPCEPEAESDGASIDSDGDAAVTWRPARLRALPAGCLHAQRAEVLALRERLLALRDRLRQA